VAVEDDVERNGGADDRGPDRWEIPFHGGPASTRGGKLVAGECVGLPGDSAGPADNQAIDVIDAAAKYDAVADHEQDERRENRRSRDGRYAVGGAHNALH